MTPESPIGDDDAASLRQACLTLADRLRSGVDCRAEEFFPACPIPETLVDSALELVYTEFVVREELGQRPSRDDWIARFPQWRERLARLFEIGPLFDAAEDILDEGGTIQPESICFGPAIAEAARQAPTLDVGEGGSRADFTARPVWIDENRLLNRVDHGATAIVYRALQVPLNRIVALKMMRDREVLHPSHQQRFEDDARKMASLSHPNIITVYSVGGDSGIPYFTMEYAEGGTLRDKIAHRPMPDRDAASCVETLARAVQYAHERNLIHRDLKPSNIVLMGDGTPKITDFGLAKEVADDPTTYATVAGGGSICGTVAYMAPEQAAGQPATRRTDIYGLGAILYEMLTGQPPFPPDSSLQSLEQIRKAEPKEPHQINARVDRSLEAICLKCLEKRPKHRYATARELAEEVGSWARGKTTKILIRSALRRSFRAALRHRLATAVLIIVALSTAVSCVAAFYKSPAHRLASVDRALREGKPGTLVDDHGLPKWFDVKPIHGDLKIETAAEGALHVSSFGVGLVELHPDPFLECYRFSADVQHTNGRGDGAVGVYLGHIQSPAAESKTIHRFCGLAFNDAVDFSQVYPNWTYPDLTGNPARFFVCRYVQPNAPPGEFIKEQFLHRFQHAPGGQWHRLAAEVTPTTVTVYWDQQQFGRINVSKLLQIANKQQDLSLDPQDLQPRTTIQGGLGIYIFRASAAFRSITIEPL